MKTEQILAWLIGRRRHVKHTFRPQVMEVKGPFCGFKRRRRTLLIGFVAPECWCYWDPDEKYFPHKEFRLEVAQLVENATRPQRRAYKALRKELIALLPYMWDSAIVQMGAEHAHN